MQRIITTVLILMGVLIPLIFTSSTFELFEFPKFLLLLGGTIVIVVAWSIHIGTTGDRTVRQSVTAETKLIDWGVITILATQLVSTLFSIHPYTSFWGYYSRFHQGLLTTICYTIIYFAAVKWLDKKSTQKLINASIKTALLISIIAILEHYDISITCMVMTGAAKFQFNGNPFIGTTSCWGGLTNPLYRSFATLGQPNWLAAYLIPHIFLVLYSYRKYAGLSQIMHWISITLMIAALIFTNSRSGFIGFVLAFIAYCIVSLRHSAVKEIEKTVISASALILIVCAALGTPFTSSFMSLIKAQTAAVEQTTGGTALETVGQSAQPGGSSSGDIRKIVWSGALELIKKHPLLGTGPETFAYTYYWVRPTLHNYTSEWDYLYNKAHNEYLNIAASAGIIGLGAYLLWHYAIMRFAWKKSEQTKKANKEKQIETAQLAPVLGASIVGFAATNFFGFSVIPVYLAMVMMAALPSVSAKEETEKLPADGLYLGMCSALSAFLIVMWPVKFALADQYFARGKAYIESGKYTDAVPILEKAVGMRPQEDLFKSYLSEALAASATDKSNVSKALALVDEIRTHSPYHLNYYKSRAKVYLTFAGSDPSFYTLAAEELEKARELAPTDPKLAYNLGLVYSRTGDIEKAEKEMKQAIELRKNYQEPYYALTLIYEQTDNTAKIPDLMQTARENLATYSGLLKEKIDKYVH